jgi:hypothetical protein
MAETIIERERAVPVELSCDVLVAGGGIAGIAAAVAAARGGKKVILLEREYALGGMATLGLVTIYLPLCDGDGHQVIFGIGEELLKLSIKYGAEACYPKPWLEGGTLEERIKMRYLTQFNPHLFALGAEKLLLSLGVNIMYGSLVCDAVCRNGKITHVVIENKSGRSAVAVGSVIDCTGDADICKLSGAPTALHGNGNGLASWYYYQSKDKIRLKMFGLADLVIDNDKPRDEKPLDDKYNAEQTWQLDGNFRFSGVDGRELSQAVIAAHGKMFDDILEAHSKDESYLPVTMSTIPLVRMSRRLVGEYELDESEERKTMPDSIGMTGDWRKRSKIFELPFGSLHCKEVKNLLVAGRDISTTDSMWDITRVIPGCAVTGEAAGTAAALSDDFTAIDIVSLQQKLKENGAKLHINEILA